MNDSAFIDTNVFLYAHDLRDHRKRGVARELIFDVYGSGSGVISTQVLCEFFHGYVVKLRMPYTNAVKELHFMSRCTVIEQTISLVVRAASLYARYSLSFWDAMILAAAIEAGADRLYTEDLQNGQVIDGVLVVNPFSSAA